MWMHFWMSTQYIIDLQRDIVRWQKKKIASWWVCQKAPLGYKNNVLEKSIEIDPINAPLVKRLFELRTERKSYMNIINILFKEWYSRKGKPFPVNTIRCILRNKFYIGLAKFNGQYYKWNFEPLISRSLFERANSAWFWVYEYKPSDDKKYYLKWLIKDIHWFKLCAYKKKDKTYYKNQYRSSMTVNISENDIFKTLWEELSKYEFNEVFVELNQEIIKDIIQKRMWWKDSVLNELNLKISKL